jgi:N,N'-diacetyllegionaminate synthase
MTLSEVTLPPAPTLQIAGRTIGGDAPAFIVAEIGVNHNGRLSKALELVDAAAAAGADAVKLQIFRAADLTTARAPAAAYQRSAAGATTQQEMLAQLELDDAALFAIVRRCADKGIICFATPFGVDDVERIALLGMPAVKIASTDLNNPALVGAAAALRVPMILSTGAATGEEIAGAVRFVESVGARERTALLHCVSRYPTPVNDANLRSIDVLRRTFGLPTGYSDHTDSTVIGGWAVAAGACILEKHFTLDRGAKGPDHALSLEPPELATYIQCVRQMEGVLGRSRLGMSEAEAEVRAIARKSVVTRDALAAGALVTAASVTLKRPGTGIAPHDLPRLIGRRLRRAVPADTVLTWDMVAAD